MGIYYGSTIVRRITGKGICPVKRKDAFFAAYLWYTKIDNKNRTSRLCLCTIDLPRQEGDGMIFNTQKYRQLELFAKKKPEQEGKIRIVSGGVYKTIRISQYRQWIKMAVNPGNTYQVEHTDCEISYAYLSGAEQIQEKGICMIQDGIFYEKENWGDWYHAPMKNQYHFMPLKGWMNDPNGFCFYKGYYHLFYQYQPFSEKWDNMYWGHAVSKDLIHWTHLPVCIEPQREILEHPELIGGAFSGHAFIDEEQKMRLFFTRHIGLRGNAKEMQEYQVMKESWDGLEFGRETVLTTQTEQGLLKDIRDPKVLEEDGEYKMLLGTGTKDWPAIALYKSRNFNHWMYEGTAFEDRAEEGVFPVECPDLFATDGKWILTAGISGKRDKAGRKDNLYYYIGEWCQDQFHAESKGLYDFGGDFYAMQSLKTKQGMVSIGWIRDTLQDHVPTVNGVCGSMSIPRINSVKEGKLYRRPIPEIYRLTGDRLYEGKENEIHIESIEGNAYHVKVRLNKPADFRMTLFKWKGRKLYLEQKDGNVQFRSIGMGAKNRIYPASVKNADMVEIFVDRNVCEVFLNDGEDVGTKKFYQQSLSGSFECHVQESDAVKFAIIEKMNSIW